MSCSVITPCAGALVMVNIFTASLKSGKFAPWKTPSSIRLEKFALLPVSMRG